LAKKPILLGDFLVQQGLITEDQLREALRAQRERGERLGRTLIELGFVDERQIIKALSEQLGVEYVSLKNYQVDPKVVKLVPEKVARNYLLMPLFLIGDTLTVAMANPLDIIAIDAVSRETGLKVESVVCTEKEILEAIDLYYGSKEVRRQVQALGDAAAAKEDEEKIDTTRLRREAAEEPIVKMVDLILTQAVRDGASDIHIDPLEKSLRVRYRIDGVLHPVYEPPKNLQMAILSRIKILADLNIAERRLPQDGRFRMTVEGRDIDFRVSVMPTLHGEAVVLRILDRRHLFHLDDLGFEEKELALLKQRLNQPNGILLVTGPTGSGKSSTLYAALRSIESVERNVVTIEDPIEYQLESVRQSQVHPKVGLTFATGLRTLLRQDPDVIMVGEIRDRETAKIAVEASLTGHLVLSTLHTNDAAGAITRLLEMEVEPYLLASALEAVIAQRLVRRVCPECRTEVEAPKAIRRYLPDDQNGPLLIPKAQGCRNCHKTGYRGRVPLYEILDVNDQIRARIMERTESEAIKRLARQQGMRTLREDGMLKVLNGLTTVTEILRVTPPDD
jgi:type IV pilus assembly protein PilB